MADPEQNPARRFKLREDADLLERVVRLEARFEGYVDYQAAITQQFHDNLGQRMHEMNDVRLRFLPRDMYDQQHNMLIVRLEALERWRATLVGVAIFGTFLAGIIGAVLGAVFGHIFGAK